MPASCRLHILEHSTGNFGSSDALHCSSTKPHCGVPGCAATRTLLQHLIRCPTLSSHQASSRARRTRSWQLNNNLKAVTENVPGAALAGGVAGAAAAGGVAGAEAVTSCQLCASIAAGWSLCSQNNTGAELFSFVGTRKDVFQVCFLQQFQS
jgi:hypothetical protein